MAFLINPAIAFMLIVLAVMLLMMTAVAPKSTRLKVGMVVCLAAAGYEFSQLNANIWALMVTAFSPVPFFIALRQPAKRGGLVILSILMLALGSMLIFWDEQGRLLSIPFGGLVAIICGRVIWITFLRFRDTSPRRLSDNPDSIIGLVGTAHSAIEKFEPGQVEIEGELWNARSDEPIPAGSLARIVRFDGLYLTVEKVERLNKEKARS